MSKKTSADQFQAYLDAPEGTQLEFKEASNNYHFDKLVDYCVALANEGGGKIILGCTDLRPRKVTGTKAFLEPGKTEGGLFQELGQRIPVEEYVTEDGCRVLIVHVPSCLKGVPWHHRGRYLKRAGEALVALGHTELKTMFDEGGLDFSAETCAGAEISDLDKTAIGDFRTRWAKKSEDQRRLQWSDEETLVNSELMVDGKLTYASLILFGTRAALGRYLAQAEIVFEYRSTEASGPAANREELREGFFLIQDTLWQHINLRNERQSYQDGLFRKEIPTFDETAIREGLLNAVAHRDYRLSGSVFVKQFSHRLEVISPGGFPPGINEDNILEQQNPRNRRLAEAFAKCGLIERSGQGINLMVENAIRQSKPLPSFKGTSSHEVRLTLEGTVDNPAFVRYLEELGEAKLRNFATSDFLVLDYLRRGLPLQEELKSRISGLVDIGAVEPIGRGRGTKYMLSHSLYAAMGAKGTYTRLRGLDKETNKTLLERHLIQQGSSGSPLSEMMQVLPALTDRGVQGLLKELQSEGRARLQGTKRWALWFSVPAKGKDEPKSD
jgi:ATP-dependent DNA helicase RecG